MSEQAQMEPGDGGATGRGLVLSQHRRLRFLAMFLFYFAQGVPMGLFLFAIPSWMVSSGATAADVGKVVATTILPWSLKLLDGFLLDRFTLIAMGRRRPWIIAAQALIALALVTGALLQPSASDVALLGAIGFIAAFAAAFQDVAVDALAVDLMPEAERSRASAIMFSGQLIGISATTAVAGRLITDFGPAAAYLVAAFLIVLILLFAFVMRERPGEKALPWSPGAAHPDSLALQTERWAPMLRATLRGLTRWQSLVFLPVLATKGIKFGFMTGATPVLAAGWMGWKTAQVTALVGTGQFVAGIGALVIGGWLGDRLGARAMVVIFLGVWLVFDSLLIFAVPLRATDWYPVLVFAGWFSIDSMLSIGLIATAMRLSSRTVAATQFTIYMVTINLGTSAGAWLLSHAGNAEGVARLIPVVMALELAGIVIFLAVRMTAPDDGRLPEG